jgi:hypothetical protein
MAHSFFITYHSHRSVVSNESGFAFSSSNQILLRVAIVLLGLSLFAVFLVWRIISSIFSLRSRRESSTLKVDVSHPRESVTLPINLESEAFCTDYEFSALFGLVSTEQGNMCNFQIAIHPLLGTNAEISNRSCGLIPCQSASTPPSLQYFEQGCSLFSLQNGTNPTLGDYSFCNGTLVDIDNGYWFLENPNPKNIFSASITGASPPTSNGPTTITLVKADMLVTVRCLSKQSTLSKCVSSPMIGIPEFETFEFEYLKIIHSSLFGDSRVLQHYCYEFNPILAVRLMMEAHQRSFEYDYDLPLEASIEEVNETDIVEPEVPLVLDVETEKQRAVDALVQSKIEAARLQHEENCRKVKAGLGCFHGRNSGKRTYFDFLPEGTRFPLLIICIY